jgi:hypothetical protein
MAKPGSHYKQVRFEDMVVDTQAKRTLSALDKPWEPKKVRYRTASILAIGLLILFGLNIICSGGVITLLVIAGSISNKPSSDVIGGIQQIAEFMKMLLPYVATPLSVALGYYFRETQGE